MNPEIKHIAEQKKCKNRNCWNGRYSHDGYRAIVEGGAFRLRCNSCGRLQPKGSKP